MALHFCIMKFKYIIVSLLLLLTNYGRAQDGFSSVGGDISSSTGSEAFSVGLVVYTELCGSGGSACQGVEQAYEIFSVAIQEIPSDINCKVFPNPASDRLVVQLAELGDCNLYYRFYNTQGCLLVHGDLISPQTELNTADFPSGIYFLNVTQSNRIVQSFKIIKN